VSSGQNIVKAYPAGLDRQRCFQLLMQLCLSGPTD